MKILKIEFQNVNSLKGLHEIDFSKAPFTISSLFAITGPTGSGKSSILDVISLALFNRIPRMPGNKTLSKADILKFGAVLTRNQKEAFARITYETRTGTYASKWEISTARTGNLKDHEMEIFDLTTGKLFDLKKSEVPSKNEELIGLSYEQFIKSVLLAQGEFAQLLKAEKKERGELLEKLTGTGIYRQLGMKAYQKFKQVNVLLEDRQKEIELLEKELLEEDVFSELKTRLKERSDACIPLEKELQRLDRLLQLKQQLKEQNSRIEEKEKLKITAEQKLLHFENEHLQKIRKHEQVQVFAEELREWQLLDKSCAELKEELSAHAKQEEENLQGINSCLEKIKSFLKSEPETENIESSLQDFSRKVRDLQQQRRQKLERYDYLKNQFHTELREVPFRLNGDLEAEELKLKELKLSEEQKLQDLQEKLQEHDLDSPESEKAKLRQEIQLGRKAQQKVNFIENLSSILEKDSKELAELKPELEELPKKIELLAAKSETLRERLNKLELKRENELLKANLEEHRHQLKDGEPCPLCGALEHPYAVHLPPKSDKLQEEITETRKELDELERQKSGFNSSLSHLKKRATGLRENLTSKQPELELQKKEFETEFSHLNPSEEAWEKFCNSREKKLELLEQFGQVKRKYTAVSAGLPIISDIKEVLTQGKIIKAELDQLYSGADIDTECLDLQNSWTGLQHQKNSLAKLALELERKLQGKTKQLEETETSLEQKIQSIDCKEIKEALQRLLPEAEYAQLRKRREDLISEKGQVLASLETLKEQLLSLQKQDVEDGFDILNEKRTKGKTQLSEILEECEELRRKKRNHEERKSKIEAIEKDLETAKKAVKKWKLLDVLIGDATGRKFNDFAQDLSLSQLLSLANRRLKDLSDRYVIDKPMEDEDDSLVAIDDHMGGQRRSVKTLSGGETFILSLSMALALSDLASKNVEINSLFIDEGFGTLDPETLDQTLDTLEKLQAESSKTIGIISHVDSLKERIATQIQLQRNGQGYSSLTVKG